MLPKHLQACRELDHVVDFTSILHYLQRLEATLLLLLLLTSRSISISISRSTKLKYDYDVIVIVIVDNS